MEEKNINFWDELDRKFRRLQKLLEWKIDGQFQHGIAPGLYPSLTPERIEKLYNVSFGN